MGYKRTRSLREILISADRTQRHESITDLPSGHFRCGSCSVCSLMTVCKDIPFPDLGFTHTLQNFSNCKSKFCVYLLTCSCGLRYVGSTRRQLKLRIQEHISRILHKVLEVPLVQHFMDLQPPEEDFSCIVLETLRDSIGIHKDLYWVLLQCESFWIFKLKSLIPRGLNQEIDFSVFL